MAQAIIFIVLIIVSYSVTGLIKDYTLHQKILDVPNRRSSHRQATPRGGGLAIVALTLIGWLLYNIEVNDTLWLPWQTCLTGAVLIAIVSWLDDLRSLSMRLRLLIHCLGAGLAIWYIGYWESVNLPLIGQLNLSWLGLLVTFFWLIGLTNAYNFMDGIDGLAGSQAVVAGVGWVLLGWINHQPPVALLGFLLAAGSLGFLGFNWPPARIFMGDVGSAFLGYSFALLSLLAATQATGSPSWSGAPVAGILLLWPFIFDASLTFCLRFLRGENIFEAHRSHLYQRLVILGYSHRTVTLGYTGLAATGLGLALLWSLDPRNGAVLIASLLPLLCLGLWAFVLYRERLDMTYPKSVTSNNTGHPLNGSNPARPLAAPAITANVSLLGRGLDIIGAGLALLLAAPVMVIISLLIWLYSPGPIFCTWRRLGRYTLPFHLYRFRVPAQSAIPGANFIRRTRLDLLPELINVLRGELRFIGTRPPLPELFTLFTPAQRLLLAVPPGLFSPGALFNLQKNVRSPRPRSTRHDFSETLPQILSIDLDYLQHHTLRTDLALCLKTLYLLLAEGVKFNKAPIWRNRQLFILDIIALLVVPAVALTLRLDSLDWWDPFGKALLVYTVGSVLVKLFVFYHFGLYRRYWHYATLNDFLLIVGAVGFATLILIALTLGLQPSLADYIPVIPRTVPLIGGMLTGIVMGGSRIGLRSLYHFYRRYSMVGGRHVLVVGAGESGSMVVREMWANPQLGLEPIAFVDDDPVKVNTHIQGLPVVGSSRDIPHLVKQYALEQAVFAIPSAPLARQREILEQCRQAGLITHSLPGVYELLAGHKTISPQPIIDMQQLLHRDPVMTECSEIQRQLSGATILVTGAGGSIGSELCRQVAQCNPARIILLGHGENSIFEITLDLRLSFPDLVTHPVIVDVRDLERVKRVVQTYRPDVIFHAAAHKHVPFMEDSISEAVTNNILGTQNVLRAAEQFGVEQFVLISSDKAVNPTSIMGVTKRLAELLVQVAAQRSGRAYMAVRFGNVLGSRGSVIPVFQRQIAAGGPVTITHPDMSRYFMTIPEAVQLVLQAVVLGRGGEIFVLDMGRPVRILDLATDLIKLSGMEPGRDIKLAYTGIRPGEKLNEELFLEGEAYQRTRHKQIFVATKTEPVDAPCLEAAVAELDQFAREMRPQLIVERLQALIPTYRPRSASKPMAGTGSDSTESLYPFPSPSRA